MLYCQLENKGYQFLGKNGLWRWYPLTDREYTGSRYPMIFCLKGKRYPLLIHIHTIWHIIWGDVTATWHWQGYKATRHHCHVTSRVLYLKTDGRLRGNIPFLIQIIWITAAYGESAVLKDSSRCNKCVFNTFCISGL